MCVCDRGREIKESERERKRERERERKSESEGLVTTVSYQEVPNHVAQMRSLCSANGMGQMLGA